MNAFQNFVRRFVGPLATEVFALCRPNPSRSEDISVQTGHVYEAMRECLRAEGGSLEHLVREWVHFRRIGNDMEPFLRSRQGLLEQMRELASYQPASIFIEQPPLNPKLQLELSFHAVIPHREDRKRRERFEVTSPCRCSECSPPSVQLLPLGDKIHLHAGNIYGTAGDAYQEAYSMYRAAAELLQRAGMSFRDVVRTWIYLRNIGRDYAEFNRARRDFYGQSGLSLLPASTGIEGGSHASTHGFLMGLIAIQSQSPLKLAVMTTPTLNEAAVYGSDFSRGIRVDDGNKITLFVSGTASLDEQGFTTHIGNLSGQLDRTILNVSTLLAGQQASFQQVVSLTTYLDNQADAACLIDTLRHRRLDGLPNTLVQAAVCRPDLLCEMEATAVLHSA